MNMPVYTLPKFECLFCGINVFAVLNPDITVPHGALFALCFGDPGMAEIRDSHGNPRVVYLCDRCLPKAPMGMALKRADSMPCKRTITFNGEKTVIEKDRLSYDDILELYLNRYDLLTKEGARPLLSITFARGWHAKPEGTIEPGWTVTLIDGMVINAYVTSSA